MKKHGHYVARASALSTHDENAAAKTDTPSLAACIIGRVRYGVIRLKRFRMFDVHDPLVECRLTLTPR